MALSQAFHDRAQELMSRYPRKRSALIMVLHEAQDEVGYLSAEAIREVAKVMDLTPADVAGVATFYSMFKMRNPGRYLISLCTNVSCAVWGADETAEKLKELIGPANEPTEDGLMSWEPVECLAFCDWAPIAQLNSRDIPQLTPERAEQLVASLRAGTPMEEILDEFRKAGAVGEHADA
ncbi:MAG TPA: NAD(P)H-dependent oxidoreductase subunit E [Actinomycetota bacterium]|nr:NAD(P)H-dependent oxidoreductase subunit E [Actinomycetota bacterium]